MAFFMIKVLLLCTTSLSLLTTPASGQQYNYLLSGDRLNTGKALIQGNYKFIIQDDCNLVLYQFREPVWSSKTSGLDSDCYLTLNETGILIINNNANHHIWTSNTANGKNGNYILILKNSHGAAVYGPSIWSTELKPKGSNDVVIATALNGTTGVSGEEQNKVREMGKIMEVI
ncbi:hypothetical protein KFK09_006558 [Dendrobium nobile]|uniref:Bulb-type lectin domain-containing protein n=1 Tax=Dendrobium nobile TaxID=94219 RepID=A0A8T3BPX9_DENNO|nr:hypothetical protein KFK09_006558 [Dendrobium nobile]